MGPDPENYPLTDLIMTYSYDELVAILQAARSENDPLQHYLSTLVDAIEHLANEAGQTPHQLQEQMRTIYNLMKGDDSYC